MKQFKQTWNYSTYNNDFWFMLKETENDIFGPYDLPIGKPRSGGGMG